MSRGHANMIRSKAGENGAETEKKNNLGRLLKSLFASYPKLMPVIATCIVLGSVGRALPSLFQQRVFAILERFIQSQNFSWQAAKSEILPIIATLIGLYLLTTLLLILQTQLMAKVTQGFLCKVRIELFNKMQDLPISYFDRNQHGDIMSHYTNDVDTLRQLIAQAIPNLIQAGLIVLTVLTIMLWFSVWMTLVILLGVVLMMLVTKKIGGGSAKYFKRQQASIGKVEGFIQESMSGQKVIKVFNHEEKAILAFDEINEQLFEDASRANGYANALGPIIMNIGNILYVLVATVGGIFLLSGLRNVGFSGMPFSIPLLVPFLNMTKQFTGNLNQVSQQVNHVAMALAGAERIFTLMDKEPENDAGKVRLVNARYTAENRLEACPERTGIWAWEESLVDGGVSLTRLEGDIVLEQVDFAYEEGKPVLHDINVYARPGQKVAFVGSTGAGKTTITNLINRFYDISEGTISYDGINIQNIRKKDLRRSLGLVLQEVNLFTGTVMENIRYGRLEASDAECKAAAELVGASHFIDRLPEGYNTVLTNNAANLSQGQRQLLSIARAAVADPPVLILDEATSSVDTHTEILVQRGMDILMQGRTVFVIAHRLSTIKNADVIMVLEGGRIIERGSHEELLGEKGTYYQLYTGAFELE